MPQPIMQSSRSSRSKPGALPDKAPADGGGSSTHSHAAAGGSGSAGSAHSGAASSGSGSRMPHAAGAEPSPPAGLPRPAWLSGRNVAFGGSVAVVLLLTVFRREIAPVSLPTLPFAGAQLHPSDRRFVQACLTLPALPPSLLAPLQLVKWLVMQAGSLSDKSVIGQWSPEAVGTAVVVALTLCAPPPCPCVCPLCHAPHAALPPPLPCCPCKQALPAPLSSFQLVDVCGALKAGCARGGPGSA